MIKCLFSIDRSTPPKNHQEALLELETLLDSFPDINKRILELSDNSYFNYVANNIYEIDFDGNLTLLDLGNDDDIDDIDVINRYDEINERYDEEVGYYGSENYIDDYISNEPHHSLKEDLSPSIKIDRHINSIATQNGSLYLIVYLCQYLCHEYKYPAYDDIKSHIPIDKHLYHIINNHHIDELWDFNRSVSSYLQLQHLYRNSIHTPEVSLKSILNDIIYKGDNLKEIDSISNRFSSRRTKTRNSLGQNIRKEILEENKNLIKQYLQKNSDTYSEYEFILSETEDQDKISYLDKCLIKLINSDNFSGEITTENIYEIVNNHHISTFDSPHYIGNKYNSTWRNFTKNTELKWSSVFDFIIANGLYFGTKSYNPFLNIENKSFLEYLSDSKFNHTLESSQKFLSGFIPKGINLSVQESNFIAMTQYILERITNINLINSIASICSPYIESTPSVKSHHLSGIIADEAAILSKYPLVDLRPRFLMFMQEFEDKTTSNINIISKSYIKYLIRHQIYIYFPLLSRLFNIMLSLSPLPIPPTYIPAKPLFDNNSLEPVCKHYSSSPLVYDGTFYNNATDKMELYCGWKKIKYNNTLTPKDFERIMKYIKMRIYHSYQREILDFSRIDFAKIYKEYINRNAIEYIHRMDKYFV